MKFLKKKHFCIIFCMLSFVLLLCSCSNLSSFLSGIVKTNDEIIKYDTISPPESGWTDELINQVLYVDNKKFSMPAMLSDIEDSFSWRQEDECEIYVDNGSSKRLARSSFLVNNSQHFMKAVLNSDNNVCQITGRPDSIYTYTEYIPVAINGVQLGSTFESVIAMLGAPNEELSSDDYLTYTFPDSQDCCICIGFTDDSEKKSVDAISVYNSSFYEPATCTTKYNTIRPPENGWTDELLEQVLYIGDKKFSMPKSLSEMESSFGLSVDNSLDNTNEMRMLKDSHQCYISVEINEDNDVVSIIGLSNAENSPGCMKCAPFMINGVGPGSTYEDVITMLGEPNKELSSEDHLVYTYAGSQDRFFTVSFSEDDCGNKLADMTAVYSPGHYE